MEEHQKSIKNKSEQMKEIFFKPGYCIGILTRNLSNIRVGSICVLYADHWQVLPNARVMINAK